MRRHSVLLAAAVGLAASWLPGRPADAQGEDRGDRERERGDRDRDRDGKRDDSKRDDGKRDDGSATTTRRRDGKRDRDAITADGDHSETASMA